MRLKKFFKGVVICLLVFCVAGCGNAKSITADDFKEKMEDKKYSVTDATYQFAGADYIEKAYIALKSDSSYQIEFYQISNEEYAVSFYNNNKSIFENSKSSTSTYTETNLGNHAKYALESDGKYKVVSKIDNTVIYLNVDSKYKDEVKDILKKLGY